MKRYIVKPGAAMSLEGWRPNDTSAFPKGKKRASVRLKELTGKLETLQELLYAEHSHKLLIILQGMDSSGKDGAIRHVFEGVNPQGVRVASFKAPTAVELDHDYFWRVHKETPAKGEIVIFNRSYYEDVLIVRVHNLVPPDVWKPRYGHINDFEKMLTDEGTTILKFYLHIDQAEQRKRLQERLDEPRKRWKFSQADVEERKLWDSYRAAYEEALARTSTERAPWRVIPANHSWYRNLVVAEIIVETLENLRMRYPEPPNGWKSAKIS